jgi:hypothetical protein
VLLAVESGPELRHPFPPTPLAEEAVKSQTMSNAGVPFVACKYITSNITSERPFAAAFVDDLSTKYSRMARVETDALHLT